MPDITLSGFFCPVGDVVLTCSLATPMFSTGTPAAGFSNSSDSTVVFLTVFLMAILAWRMGAFDELKNERQLESFDRNVWLEIDEADWEDRQHHFRREHPRMGHRRPHMSLGRKR